MIRMSIRRPVAVTMVYLSVAVLGVLAWRNIPLELLPDATFPQLNLRLAWTGASPETMEAFATAPVEASIQQVRGVERITSNTTEGSALITVWFARGTDMEFARLDLSERIATLEESLPDGVSPIQIQPYVPREFETQASRAFLQYTFTGPLLIEALRGHLDRNVVPELLQIPGVADVRVDGGRARLLEIELDPERIAAVGLRPEQVASAVSSLQLIREAGAVREGEMEWSVTIRSRPTTAEELRSAILPIPGGRVGATPVRLGEVGVIRDTFEDPTSHYRISGSPALGLSVIKEYGTNTVALSEVVRERIAALEPMGPAGSRFILVADQSEEIQRQLSDLRSRAAIAAGVIFLVLLGFLRSFRTAGIVFSTIAFSILIALNLIYFGGLTLNILTLMGLALGFGLIVDNSIVVLENIFRQWQEGRDPPAASEKGARDVVLPILASTATTLIVFLPFLYLQGELRIYYLPLAIVVALTLVSSIFVAFTFIPALTARLLRGRGGAGGGARLAARTPLYQHFYAGLLGFSLRFPWITVLIAVLCFGATYRIFDQNVVRGVMWGGGGGVQRTTLHINMTMPRGSDLERLDELTRFFEERLAQIPEIERFESRVEGLSSRTTVWFPPHLELTAVPLVIQERVTGLALGFTGVQMSIFGMGQGFSTAAGGVAPNYRITILGYNYDRLAEIAEDLAGRLLGQTRIREVDANASAQFSRDRASEWVAEIDRESAARYGITVAEAAGLLQAFLRSGSRSGVVTLGGDPVNFAVRLEGFREADIRSLLETVVATPEGVRIPVGDLVTMRERNVLTSIRRENQQYERSVAYEFQGPRLLGDLIRDQALEATYLPAGYSLRETTPFLISSLEQRQMRIVLFVALGLVFMVTAALFESIRQPLVVLLAVPMALIGVFLTFFFVRASFTREAYIGVIMMGGIVVNNAILLVDHINRVRVERGELPLREAIVKATLERVRPILMTTATTVLGLLPLVLFMPTADARIWNALTYALIGGLLSSTLFVLTTTPALYYLFERRRAEGSAALPGGAVAVRGGAVAALLILGAMGCAGSGDGAGAELDDLPLLTAVEELRLGDVDDPELGFSQVGSVAVDRDGRMYIYEQLAASIRVHDSRGAYLHSIGRRGEGPGEFRGVSRLGILGDTVWTIEFGQRRVTLFDRSGHVLSTARALGVPVQLQVPTQAGVVIPFHIRRDGQFTSGMPIIAVSSGGGEPAIGPNDTILVPRILFAPDGSSGDTIGWDPYPPAVTSPDFIRVGPTEYVVPFPPDSRPLVAHFLGGRYLIERPYPGSAGTHRIRVVRLTDDEDTLFARELSYLARPFSEARLEALAEESSMVPGGFIAVGGGVAPTPEGIDIASVRRQIRQAMRFPPFQLPFDLAVAGDDGTLWLREENDGTPTARWVVLDGEGEPTGALTLPRAHRVAWVAQDAFIAVEPDALQIPWVVRYRIEG